MQCTSLKTINHSIEIEDEFVEAAVSFSSSSSEIPVGFLPAEPPGSRQAGLQHWGWAETLWGRRAMGWSSTWCWSVLPGQCWGAAPGLALGHVAWLQTLFSPAAVSVLTLPYVSGGQRASSTRSLGPALRVRFAEHPQTCTWNMSVRSGRLLPGTMGWLVWLRGATGGPGNCLWHLQRFWKEMCFM